MNLNLRSSVLIIFTLSNLCFSKDSESFLLKSKYRLNEDQKYVMDMIMEFSIPGYGDIYFNFGAKISHRYLGEEKENGIYVMSWDEVIATVLVNDKTKPVDDLNDLDGEIITMTVSSDGEILDRKGSSEYSEEVMEQGETYNDMFMGGGDNFFFPFATDTLQKPGDTWKFEYKKEHDSFPGTEDAEGWQKKITEYTFKKVKKKKGNMVAYIKTKGTSYAEMYQDIWDREYRGIIEGNWEGDLQFDITRGVIIKSTIKAETIVTNINLENDEEEKFFQTMEMKMKWKK